MGLADTCGIAGVGGFSMNTLRLASGGLFYCVSIGYTLQVSKKDSGFRIRVETELHQKFVEICRAQDRPAAQVIREFMRAYVAEHGLSLEQRRVREER